MARGHKVTNNLREIRKAKGMTLEQLAEKMDVHFTTIAKIERAERGLTFAMLTRLSGILGVKPIEILHTAEGAAQAIVNVPMLGRVVPSAYKEALNDPDGFIPVPGAGPNAFALKPESDSMDMLVAPDAVVVVDPDDVELQDGKVYAVENSDGENAFKRFRTDPLRFEPVSSNPSQTSILLGQELLRVIGRVVWQASAL